MTPENQEFTELRRLLQLKRHEQPPPGFFENFPASVIRRIEAQSDAATQPWWTRWLAEFDLRPAVACAYSLAVGGLLIVGLSVALDRPADEANALRVPALDQPLLAAGPAPDARDIPQPQLTLQPVPLPGDEASAVGAVINPDAAPAGFFRNNGFLGDFGLPQQSPATLNLR